MIFSSPTWLFMMEGCWWRAARGEYGRRRPRWGEWRWRRQCWWRAASGEYGRK
ncbi:hypothetical protein R6Q59_034642 [Mikania micrantha]